MIMQTFYPDFNLDNNEAYLTKQRKSFVCYSNWSIIQQIQHAFFAFSLTNLHYGNVKQNERKDKFEKSVKYENY